MINWERIDYAIFNHNLHHYDLENDCAYNADEVLTTAHNDRAVLIDVVNQFRPHPFDPDDRGTWPEELKDVLAWNDRGLVKIIRIDSNLGGTGWLETQGEFKEQWYSLRTFKWWMNLPETEESK